MPNRDYKDVRIDYDFPELNIEDLKTNPFEYLSEWVDFALKENIRNANAASLATIDREGFPQNRVLLVKEITSEGLIFYTNYQGAKGVQLAVNPKASLNFYWRPFERQVRVVGLVEKISLEKSQAYFSSRPKLSQISALASPQSSVITKEELYEKVKELEAMDKLPLPEHWGGYLLRPHQFEFWQGRPSRLHDRFQYNLSGKQWTITRLAP